ncbi:hydrogenase maturation factor [groundwater metagenome]
MDTQVKRYNIVVRGKVQDVGFRDYLNEIKSRKYVSGVEIDSLQQKELSMDFDIPVRFVKLSTDELYDIDRKLGIGNDLLADIKTNTINIKNGVYSLNSKFDSLNTKFDLFFEEQKGFNKNIIEHNFRLEKILEKLSEK